VLNGLFDKHVQFFFPKFGISKGLDGFKSFSAGFGGSLVNILHNFEDYNYVVAGNTIVVEGSESGELKNGGTYNRNRFCSVFEFDNGLITQMHIYGDPDITNASNSSNTRIRGSILLSIQAEI
jgi:hypothetical protein